MLETPFISNALYKRREIHEKYGGNWQSGISASGKYPYIFIFSGSSGHQHGYIDQWENDYIFFYSGEGQVGDMTLTKGNLALANHIKTGKRVFLFEATPIKGVVTFKSELILNEYDFYEGKDRLQQLRVGIKFFFRRVDVKLPDYIPKQKEPYSIEEYKDYILSRPKVTEKQGLVTSRVGQGAYRKSILYRWEYQCAVTRYSKNDILIASHIVPWKDATDDERLDVNNGILLSPTYDALFDQNLISFENNGKIILSSALEKTDYHLIGITGSERISNFSDDNFNYLERHRQILG